jgi:hypothetical protein
VEGIKTGKKDGVALFRKVLQQYTTSKVFFLNLSAFLCSWVLTPMVQDDGVRLNLVADIILPVAAAEGGFGCPLPLADAKAVEVFVDGQAALLECWEMLLDTVRNSIK